MTKECSVASIECGELYCGVPQKVDTRAEGYHQPWSGYEPETSKKKRSLAVQEANIKEGELYEGIEVGFNEWMSMACDEALSSVKKGGGPFGAVVIQVDDETNEVIRYWRTHNSVTKECDPTAHAEINAIRSACSELGVFDLSEISKKSSKLPQSGATSHCEIYSSTEPCPMCYSAVYWARIPVLVFGATRFDAAVPGVEFSDQELYEELEKNYENHVIMVHQASCPNSLDAFNHWKVSDVVKY